MDLIGLDLNATRVLASGGPLGAPPHTLSLAGTQVELPMALSLERRRAEVGHAALAICRRSPYLVCRDFLPHLGTDRTWVNGRHKYDAAKATSLVLEILRPVAKGSGGVALTVPSYLTNDQSTRLRKLAEKARLPILGLATAPLAIAWAMRMEEPWTELAMVADIDEHALTWTALGVSEGQVCLLGQRTLAQLGMAAWKNRLVNALADRFVSQSRRDPRDSADAEQMLYNELDRAGDAYRHNRLVEFAVETDHWYQNLVLRPEEYLGITAALAQRAAAERHALDEELTLHEPARTLFMTAAAAQMPGLVEAVRDSVKAEVEIIHLPADAAARAAHELAACMHRGELPRSAFDLAIPLVRGRDGDTDSFPGIDPIIRTGF
jgi:hypothetical protein